MNEYIRTTRECSVSQLHPELLQAIRKYFQEHELGDLQAETVLCCETISRNKNSGKTVSWLGEKSDITIHLGMLLTFQQLIWVQYDDKSGTHLSAANLNNIRARYYTSTLMKDAGLEVVGYIGESNSRLRGHIAMGTDLAAQKFCETVRQATIRENPPPQGWLKWLSGDW